MQALRGIKELRNHQAAIDLPPGPGSDARVEVIVLAANELAVLAALLTRCVFQGRSPQLQPTYAQHRPYEPTQRLADRVAVAMPWYEQQQPTWQSRRD